MSRKEPSTQRNRKKEQRSISKITVAGFKSIQTEQSLPVRPLTILAGANSSGKSSIMQPLLLLKQTIDAPYDSGALKLDGPNVKFTNASQFLCRSSGTTCQDEFTLRFDLGKGWVGLSYKIVKGVGVCIEKMLVSADKGKFFEFRENMPSSEIMAFFKDFGSDFIRSLPGVKEPGGKGWHVRRERCFLQLSYGIGAGNFFAFPTIPANVTKFLENIIHVPGLRGNPERTYKVSGVTGKYPGTFDNYVASVLSLWQKDNDTKLNELGTVLASLGLTWKVASERVDDTQVGIKVGRMTKARQGGARDLVSIADVGFGLSQVLPVVVALLVARPGQLVYIEQPEIHLHPKAQLALSRFFADVASSGVIIVVETHSALFLRGLQILVAEKGINRDIVSLNWFTRDEKSGMTTVNTAEMDEKGSMGPWPVDFDTISWDADRQYLDAVETGLE